MSRYSLAFAIAVIGFPACSSSPSSPAADAAPAGTIDSAQASSVDARPNTTIDSAVGDSPDATPTTPDAAPQSNDPFDDNSCAGDPITFHQAIALFPAGASSVTLGSYVLYTKSRMCNDVTGCSNFGDAIQATAQPPAGNDNGGFGLAGSVRLDAGGGNAGNYLFLNLVDNSSTENAYGTTEFNLDGISDSNMPVPWPTAGGYTFEMLDNLFIPPLPDDGAIVADFTVTMTTSCLRIVGLPNAQQQNNEYALLMRF